MKLRLVPDDFIVDEVPSKEWKAKGAHAVYCVSKVNMTTFAAEKVLSKYCKVSFKKIGYAGLKDTHGRTSQFFSVETSDPSKGVFVERNVSSELVGFVDEKIRVGELKGNNFAITVRSLSEGDVKVALRNVDSVRCGVPNYFDSQRFGSLSRDGFIAKDVLRGDYESALKKVVTRTTRHQRAVIRQAKRFVAKSWGNWKVCLDHLVGLKLERTGDARIVRYLFDHPGDFKGAFRLIFGGVRELFFSSYQAFIWNECVGGLVRRSSKGVFSVPYAAGFLVFPRVWHSPCEGFPLISSTVEVPSKFMSIVTAVLEKEKLSCADFVCDEYFFLSRVRPVCVVPENFSVEVFDDERHVNRKKLVVKFFLPKGAYATVVLKALFEK